MLRGAWNTSPSLVDGGPAFTTPNKSWVSPGAETARHQFTSLILSMAFLSYIGDFELPLTRRFVSYEWSLPYHLRDLYRDDGSSRY